ncbi:hypothetical protein BDN67DRAFT_985386 [Paxillus ammoniavirescens]|nr:hypothetical protein BDN67DRAFT_985386 [Paxillus ammoniavirescens]
MPPFGPTFSSTSYPTPFNGADGQIFAQSFNQHYHHFTEDQGQGVDIPAAVQLDLPVFPRQHSQAITFIRNQDIVLISVLEEAGAQWWVELCSHLALLAWRNLVFNRFQPQLAEYWEVQLTHVNSQYIQKGMVFEDVHIIITPPQGTFQIVPTHIDVSKFTNMIIKMTTPPSLGILHSTTWRRSGCTGKGYGYLHKYKPLPGIGQARNSNIVLFEFCSTCFMASIDFILNYPNRKADTKWKTEMASHSKLVSSFFKKVLSLGPPALEESLFVALYPSSSETITSAGAWNSGATVTYSLHIREALYQSEMIQRWWLALAKKEAAKHHLEAAQQEFEDYESNNIEVIGPAMYNHFLNICIGASPHLNLYLMDTGGLVYQHTDESMAHRSLTHALLEYLLQASEAGIPHTASPVSFGKKP